MGFFRAAHGYSICGQGGGKRPSFPKICDRYPTMMKLGTLIPYLKKIQEIHKSPDATLELW